MWAIPVVTLVVVFLAVILIRVIRFVPKEQGNKTAETVIVNGLPGKI